MHMMGMIQGEKNMAVKYNKFFRFAESSNNIYAVSDILGKHIARQALVINVDHTFSDMVMGKKSTKQHIIIGFCVLP